MINSFDTEVAQDIGINAAIIYKNIQYWCEKNRTNGQNEHEGLFWTYNSIVAFTEQFPYMTAKQIRSALKTLEERGYIRSGNFNNSAYDRTKWYSDIRAQMETSTSPEGKNDLTVRANGNSENGEPIPNIEPNNNTNNKQKEERKKENFDSILDADPLISSDPELRQIFVEFIKMRQRIRAPLTDYGLKCTINNAKKISAEDIETMKAVVAQSIQNSWRGIFPLKEENRITKRETQENEFGRLLAEEGYT